MIRLSIAAACMTVALVSCSGNDPTKAPSDVAAPPADALKTPSGLASKVINIGFGGEHPTAQSSVTVNYTGWTPDGKMFDSSAMHGGPLTFPLIQVIPGWTEGVQLMVRGEKRRFWVPGKLAYDPIDQPGVPKGNLVFDIELLEIH
jgi:peptidylprolyl isomerase